MLLLISDANILIDIEAGDLIAPMFSLGYQFSVPDVLFYEELEEQHAHFLELGLQVQGLDEKGIQRVQALSQTYKNPSRNDLFALVLAEIEKCPLLTGDSALRRAAEAENLKVNGTLWLIGEMIQKKLITTVVARAALKKMQNSGRRLPWELAESLLASFEKN
jgi:predicted nucleic acid-binding protein